MKLNLEEAFQDRKLWCLD